MAFDEKLEAFPPGKALDIVAARVRFGGQERTQPVASNDQEVSFTIEMPKGKTDLQTWFRTRDGHEFGAHYIYIRRL
jgi:hypothetical protein